MKRKCSICGKVMQEGYIIDNGAEYYCSDKCLHMVYTAEEYQEMYKSDVAFWTEWEDETSLKSAGTRLKRLREAAGRSQMKVAEDIGVHEMTIYNIENGKRGFSIVTLLCLSEYYGVTTDYILKGE